MSLLRVHGPGRDEKRKLNLHRSESYGIR